MVHKQGAQCWAPPLPTECYSLVVLCCCPLHNLRQVAVIAGNLELADVIQLHKPEDIGELHCSTYLSTD